MNRFIKCAIVCTVLGVGGYLILKKSPKLMEIAKSGVQKLQNKLSSDSVDMIDEAYLAGMVYE